MARNLRRRGPQPVLPSKGSRVTSVVSLRTFANSSSVPIVVFVDMQQEYLAKPRLLAISEIDRALDNCRKVLDHSRKIGLPVAFIRLLNESAFFNRATPFARWIEGFEPYRNEMVFERNSRRIGEPKPGWHRDCRICGRIGLPVDFDRCVPPQSQGHLSVRRIGQSRTRRDAGGRDPPRGLQDIRSLWRGI